MVYMYHSFLIHSSADGHLGCFHVLPIINSAAMNIGVHVSLSDLVSSECMPKSGIAGSYGSSISRLETFLTVSSWRWVGIQWAEARVSVKCTVQFPTTKNYLAPNASSAEVGKYSPSWILGTHHQAMPWAWTPLYFFFFSVTESLFY